MAEAVSEDEIYDKLMKAHYDRLVATFGATNTIDHDQFEDYAKAHFETGGKKIFNTTVSFFFFFYLKILRLINFNFFFCIEGFFE